MMAITGSTLSITSVRCLRDREFSNGLLEFFCHSSVWFVQERLESLPIQHSLHRWPDMDKLSEAADIT